MAVVTAGKLPDWACEALQRLESLAQDCARNRAWMGTGNADAIAALIRANVTRASPACGEGDASRDRLWDAILGELNLAYARGQSGEPAGSMDAADRIRRLATAGAAPEGFVLVPREPTSGAQHGQEGR